MSRPRKPFGANHPGRLPATMLKVLAAEMSDPARLRRGKQYAKDGSVLDIMIEPGVVTAEIQGSRSTPYITSIVVSSGSGMPLRRDVTTQCSCPDDDNFDGYACKHAVAAMFVLSDEFLLEPELLDVWRATSEADIADRRQANRADGDGDGGHDRGRDASESAPNGRPERRRGHLRLVGDNERVPAPRPRPETARPGPVGADRGDLLDGLLEVPVGTALPDVPRCSAIEALDPADERLAAALRDAKSHLRLDWD